MLEFIRTRESLFSLLSLAVSFAVAFALTPLAQKLAIRCDCLDRPDGKRKIHGTPVPYFGGLSILLGFVVSAIVCAVPIFGGVPRDLEVMILGGIAVCLVGLIDDMYDMNAFLKFFLQILLSVFAAVFGGAIEYTTVFGKTITFGVFAIPVTVFWMVLIINAVNLIDGLDGLAGGVTALEAFALFVTALIMGNAVCMLAAAALCGAALGFLPYNVNHAKIFMGDAGSMFIGYILACTSVFGLFKAQALFSVIVPAILFALPILDAVLAVLRRVLKGQSPFRADRRHLHHRLLDNGFSPRQSVLLIYFAAAIFCVASILFMKYKYLSIAMVAADLLFLEALKNKRKLSALWHRLKDKKG